MNAKVDKETCMGCGLCESICSDVFRIGDDGLAEAYADVPADKESKVTDAIESCPVDAISREE